ncbi:MAG: PAS domain-containing sensor histidine kinase [bacterium]|nr:PAS domain-containing sensor histidine kinase [bacterium]
MENNANEILECESQLHNSFDNMLEGVQIVDSNWRYKYVNDALTKQSKLTKEELLGYTMLEKYPGIESTEMFKALQQCMTKRVSNYIETEFKFHDNSTSWFNVSIKPIPEGLLILTIEVTNQKNAEAQFQESEIFSSAILSSLNSHIAVIGSNGGVLMVNKAWDDFAKENGEARNNRVSIGSNYFDVCKKSILRGDLYAEAAMEGIKSVFNKENVNFELEYPCHSPDEKRWFILKVTPFEGEAQKVVIAHLDVTQHKMAEMSNKANETKYRRLFESAKDGILILNADTGKIEDVNPFLVHILGFPFNYFIGKELWEIGLFKDKEASKTAFLELQENKYIRYDDLPLKTKEGKHLNVEFVSNVYLVNEQKVIQCNIRDITERVAAEESIRKSERRLIEAQEISHTGNWEMDLITNVSVWSDGFYNILGLKRQSIPPSIEAFLDLIYFEDRANVKKGIQETLNTLTTSTINFRFIHNDGSLKFVYSECQFEFDNKNIPVRLYGIVQDITEQRKVEERLELQNNELKKINSELDKFVYSTSHDLRAPLTSVLGLIDIIDENILPTDIEQKELIGMMKQSISKLDNFIVDIISYSRNSRMEIEKDIINFEELINESRQTLEYMEGDSQCKINVDVIQIGKFISDRTRLLTNLNNLISNAIKYQDKSKPNSYINITVHSNDWNAIITIEDNGIGIADDKQERVFEMFYRATKLSKGSGLGMYIVKETLDKLNGTITVKSKLNIGTTFTVTLPNLI